MSKYMGVSHTGQKATNQKTGQVRFANAAEVTAGVATDVVPSVADVTTISGTDLASPPAIGSTTPAAGTFTDLISDSISLDGGAVTDNIGQTVLVSGTVTIANTNIAATDRIFVSHEGANASTALGVLDVAITASTSFTITALDATTPANTKTGDLSTINYFIVRQS
jgi:hypothetical protein